MATAWSSLPTFSAGAALTAAQMTTIANDLSLAGNRPQAFAYANSSQSLNNGSATVISLGAETVDTDGMHSTTTYTYRITAQTAGYYACQGTVAFAASSSGVRYAYLTKNNDATGLMGSNAVVIPSSSTYPTTVTTPTIVIPLVVGDWIQLQAWQNAGSLNTVYDATLGYTCSLSLQWVAPA